MLHLKDLHCFVLVYELHSFSRAAENLDTVQSQISSRIQRLEQLMGTPLFLRMHRDVLPTRKGALLYEHAKRIMREVDELESAVKVRELENELG
jgi:DNA-binding transcriptional LysR family regulator